MYAAGQYEQSVGAYDDYLRRYPTSIAAHQGRKAAAAALDGTKSKTSVTARPASGKTTAPKDEAPKSRWQRIKKIFTGKTSKK